MDRILNNEDKGEIMDKVEILEDVSKYILINNINGAKRIIETHYPFKKPIVKIRKYTDKEKMEQFVKDGFIDRYSGQKLVNPGLLKVLSYYMPDVFPYHSHWKMENCHNAYWELVSTLDHIFPIALGGSDDKENWTTTSMLHNSIKSNWTLKQLNWKLYESGDFKVYDGLTSLFVQLVEADETLLNDSYIYRWYHLSKKIFDDKENQL